MPFDVPQNRRDPRPERPKKFSVKVVPYRGRLPDKAIVQAEAAALGLVAGLRVQDRDERRGPSRCPSCDRWNHGQVVWVPTDIRKSDSPEDVSEVCRTMSFDGHFRGWCVPCAKKLSGSGVSGETDGAIAAAAFLIMFAIGLVMLIVIA